MKNSNAAHALRQINRQIEIQVANLAVARTALAATVRTFRRETNHVFGPSGHCCRSVVEQETVHSDGYDAACQSVRSAEVDLEDLLEKKSRLLGRMGWRK